MKYLRLTLLLDDGTSIQSTVKLNEAIISNPLSSANLEAYARHLVGNIIFDLESLKTQNAPPS